MLAALNQTFVDAFAQVLVAIALLVLAYISNGVRKLVNRKTIKHLRVEDKTWADLKIHELLASMRDRFSAQRAYLARFHNGDHYIDGSEVLKVTRTHEVVGDGFSYQSDFFKGIPLSGVPDEVKLAVDDGPSFFKVGELVKGKFKFLCMQGGVVSGARCAVRKEGRIIGFVGIDFDCEEKPVNIEMVVDYAGRVETLL